MIFWVIYKLKDQAEQPRAIPFAYMSILKLWLEQQKLRIDVLDITISINELIHKLNNESEEN